MEVGKSQNVIGQQKTCYKASHVCAAEGSSKSAWGIQKVHFSPTRWQHFFATKKGWGVDPRGPRQKIETYRPRYYPPSTRYQKFTKSV